MEHIELQNEIFYLCIILLEAVEVERLRGVEGKEGWFLWSFVVFQTFKVLFIEMVGSLSTNLGSTRLLCWLGWVVVLALSSRLIINFDTWAHVTEL